MKAIMMWNFPFRPITSAASFWMSTSAHFLCGIRNSLYCAGTGIASGAGNPSFFCRFIPNVTMRTNRLTWG